MKSLGLVGLVLMCACGGAASGVDGGAGGGAAGGGAGGGGGGGSAGGSGGGSDAGPTFDAGLPDGGTLDCGDQELVDLSIPMRDGKTLAAWARVPKQAGCALPVVLIQTPYGKDNAKATWFGDGGLPQPLFQSKDYAFVVEDWRGFFGSSAAKVTGTQPYGEDGYDTVEWIATQPWSNGKVGTWGVSALCQQQYRTAVLKPPHLVAAVPIFCELNTEYEQFYPGGVLRREYYNFVSLYFGATLVLSTPYDNGVWAAASQLLKPADITVPMLLVTGWYDLTPTLDFRTFDSLVAGSPAGAKHRLVIGDWIHFATGGESVSGRALTPQELLYVDTAGKIQQDSRDWFDLHLRGQTGSAASAWSKVRYVRSGEGVWESADQWPPPGQVPTTLYLNAAKKLVAAAPAAATLTLPYDPKNPSPTIGGATLLPNLIHGPQNQAAVISRGDALSFTGTTLAAPLRIRGPVQAFIDLKTTGYDTDVAIRLTDVEPDGGQLLIGEGIRRLKLRNALGPVPDPVDAGSRATVPVTLTNELAYTWGVGHAVGLIITGSNYPRFDANPNNGQNFLTDAGFTTVVTDTLFLDGASKLVLPVDP